MRGFDYAGPATVEEAVAILDKEGEDATILAGGQSLIILLQQRLVRPAIVVGLRRIAELDGVRLAGERLALGAMTTYSTVSASSTVRERAGILCRAAGSVGSVHIRNRGTVGGSVCHADPAGDVPTVLLALGANLVATASGGIKHTYPVDTFFTGFFETLLPPRELLLSIEVDAQPPAATHGYRRFYLREGEYPMCVAAVRLLWDEGRCVNASLAVGGAADRPQRLAAAERTLTGFSLPASWSRDTPAADGGRVVPGVRELLRGVRDEVDPLPDVRGSAEWKSRVVERVVIGAVEEAVAERMHHA